MVGQPGTTSLNESTKNKNLEKNMLLQMGVTHERLEIIGVHMQHICVLYQDSRKPGKRIINMIQVSRPCFGK